MTFSTSIDKLIAIQIKLRSHSVSLLCVHAKYVFIILSAENNLSTVAVVLGNVIIKSMSSLNTDLGHSLINRAAFKKHIFDKLFILTQK